MRSRPTFDDTDWALIVRLYDALEALAPSPVVRLNRAVAVSMAAGPDAGDAHRRRTSSPRGRWRTSGRCMRCARNCSSGWASRMPRPTAFRRAAELPGNEAEGARAARPGRRAGLTARAGSGLTVPGLADLTEDAIEVLNRREIYDDLAFSRAE